jgi:hypothetical protein
VSELSEAYLAAAAAQLGGVAAFLGGFAATFMAALLAARLPGRAAGVAIVLSAMAAVGFIISVVGATGLQAGLHPDAPELVSDRNRLALSHAAMGLGFMAGMIGLLLAIGAGGWIRSKKMGLATSGLALISLAILIGLTITVG